MYADKIATVVQLALTLKDVFQTETVDSEPGDSYRSFWEGVYSEFTTSPIKLRDFFDYILVAEVATMLIALDLQCSKAEAYSIWSRSKDYGNAFHGDVDDGTIDDINIRNVKAQVRSSFIQVLSSEDQDSGLWDGHRKRSSSTSSWEEGTVTCDFHMIFI